jgi:predicted transcriptional regulator
LLPTGRTIIALLYQEPDQERPAALEKHGKGRAEVEGKNTIANLYRYSDLSVEAIAQQVDMEADKVQEIIDDLVKNDALEVLVDQSMARVEKIMTPAVISLDCSKTAREAAALIAEKEIGSVVVTKNGKPFGIVTHSDIVRWAGLRQKLLDAKLEGSVSRPIITIGRGSTVEEAAKVMIKNQIHMLLEKLKSKDFVVS